MLVRASSDGATGLGEGAPSRRVLGADADAIEASLSTRRAALSQIVVDGDGPPRLDHLDLGGPVACAVDGAVLDLWSTLRNEPLHRALGLPAGEKVTTGTVSLDTADAMADEAEALCKAGFRALKIKLGEGPEADARRVAAVRDVAGSLPLRVDGNEGWSLAAFRAVLPALADAGVDLIEQPLSRHAVLDDVRAVTRLSREYGMAHVLDEAVQTATQVEAVGKAKLVDGVNLKLQKAGGLRAGLDVVRTAHARDLRVLLGCFIETWAGIALGAQLVGLVDWVDLDGAWLLAEEPVGPRSSILQDGKIRTTSDPGLGVAAAPGLP